MTKCRLGFVAIGIESALLILVLSLESKIESLSAGIGLALLQFPASVMAKSFIDSYYSAHQKVLPMFYIDAFMFVVQTLCIWFLLVCAQKIVGLFKHSQL
jgi:hypothetical protein